MKFTARLLLVFLLRIAVCAAQPEDDCTPAQVASKHIAVGDASEVIFQELGEPAGTTENSSGDKALTYNFLGCSLTFHVADEKVRSKRFLKTFVPPKPATVAAAEVRAAADLAKVQEDEAAMKSKVADDSARAVKARVEQVAAENRAHAQQVANENRGRSTAQGSITPAGGKWQHVITYSALSGAQSESLLLRSDNEVGNGNVKGTVSFQILCSNGRWKGTALDSPAVLAVGDTQSDITHISQQTVQLRTDNRIHEHRWNIGGDFKTLYIDHGATNEFISGEQARIQFSLYPRTPVVAAFTTSGLNSGTLEAACGGKKRKR